MFSWENKEWNNEKKVLINCFTRKSITITRLANFVSSGEILYGKPHIVRTWEKEGKLIIPAAHERTLIKVGAWLPTWVRTRPQGTLRGRNWTADTYISWFSPIVFAWDAWGACRKWWRVTLDSGTISCNSSCQCPISPCGGGGGIHVHPMSRTWASHRLFCYAAASAEQPAACVFDLLRQTRVPIVPRRAAETWQTRIEDQPILIRLEHASFDLSR